MLLAKRYQQNPQGGFPTFQIDVQMQSSIINRVLQGVFVAKAFIFRGEIIIYSTSMCRVYRGDDWRDPQGVPGSLGLNLSGIYGIGGR